MNRRSWLSRTLNNWWRIDFWRIGVGVVFLALLASCGGGGFSPALSPDGQPNTSGWSSADGRSNLGAPQVAGQAAQHTPEALADAPRVTAGELSFIPLTPDEQPAPELVPHFKLTRAGDEVTIAVDGLPASAFAGGYLVLPDGMTASVVQPGALVPADALFLGVTGLAGYVPIAVQAPQGGADLAGTGVLAVVELAPGGSAAAKAPSSIESKVARAGAVTPRTSLAPVLTWQERNPGDYNLDGEVSIADVSELGRHFGARVGDGVDDRVERAVDGNGDGEVNLTDLTEIGRGYGSRVAGYQVYRAGAAGGPWERLAFIPRSGASVYPGTVLYSFVDVSAAPEDPAWYSFAPVDDVSGAEGARSEALYYNPQSPGGVGRDDLAAQTVVSGTVRSVVVADELLVTAKAGADYQAVQDWVYGVAEGEVLGRVPHTETYLVSFLDDAEASLSRLNALRGTSAASSDLIEHVQYNLVLFSSDAVVHFRENGAVDVKPLRQSAPYTPKQAAQVADDPLRSEEWHLDQINVNAAWDVTEGAGVLVAIIDSGAEVSHRDLAPNVAQTVILDDYGNPTGGTMRDGDTSYNHGTHTAGTVGAAMNGFGVVGVAPACDLMIIRTGSPMSGGYGFTTSSIAAGIYAAADAGAGVLSMSLGGPADPYSDQVLADAVDFATARGVIVCAAAGNESSSNDWSPVSPASLEGVVSVGATGPGGNRAPYSNYGDSVDISAPGGDMSSSDSGGVLSTSAGDGFRWLQGTSMATPHVAGLCALLKARDSGLTSDEAAQVLRQTGHAMPDMGPRVDAAAAVLAVDGGGPGPGPDPEPGTLAPPSNLHASASVTEVYLEWDAVSGAEGYHVYYGLSPDTGSGWFRLTSDGPVAGTAITVTGAQTGQTYYFAVTAVNAQGESRFSSVVEATPGGGQGGLDAPRNLRATAGESTVQLTWDPPSTANLAGYHVYGSTSSDLGYGDQLTWWPITETEAMVYNLSPGVKYYFAVTAVDSYWQESSLSQVVSVTVGGSPAPDPDPYPHPDPEPDPGLDGTYRVTDGQGMVSGWGFDWSGGTVSVSGGRITLSGGPEELGWCTFDTSYGWDVSEDGGTYSASLVWSDRSNTNSYASTDGWWLYQSPMASASLVVELDGQGGGFASIYAVGWDYTEYYAEYELSE